jgi:hypothetical protein
MMKNVHINSKILLHSMNRKIVEYLELANRIPDEDFRVIVHTAQQQKKYLKNITDNVERANLFMIVFFVRELIEAVLHSEEWEDF